MGQIKIKLHDGSEIIVQKGCRIDSVLNDSNKFVVAKYNDNFVDLTSLITEPGYILGILPNSEEGKGILRHSASHIMAQAVMELFPGIKIAIGPAIENGFYYDFERAESFTPDDLEHIEKRMHEIIKKSVPIVREDISKEQAIEYFKQHGEIYKVELLEDIADNNVSIYKQGDFVDLCRGPHLIHTGKLKAFKLLSIAGAYWRGNEKNKMLQRIYGTAFPTSKELKEHLNHLEEVKKRDHRKLGKELDLFSLSEEVGAGMILWHPKGAMFRYLLEDFEIKEHLKRGYQKVIGPQLLRSELWKKSGHFDHYRENMYFSEIDNQSYGIKPMNCLAHMLIYKSHIHSYRDLPIRYFELGTVHRHEKSGVLHGLLRVREFTQDDAHILCTPEQLDNEIKSILDFIKYVMGIFGFKYEVEISTRPEHSIGSDEDWERATNALKSALEESGTGYDLNEGDGAFYGPKIDFKLKDALDRKWQCATIQCDFTLPERFELSYVGQDGVKYRPVMLHRVILGAIERFVGILIEHYAGAFPVWLSPVQAVILTVTDRVDEYAQNLYQELIDADIRVEMDIRNEKLGLKVREAQLQKIPYMLIIGDKEVSEKRVTLRCRDDKKQSELNIEDFIGLVKKDCDLYR
uniref:Threonine--tRNA ligase n=1 Tax=uncultured delta proteobacterium TaxID=34034 RepID=Q2YZU9_9DELT|nr:threonyl-tRNA synthetase [uncultured delta proteobacterium]